MIGKLQDFPWAALEPHLHRAAQHPDGLVNLAFGTPVDPTPDVVRRALREAADAPGLPRTEGVPELREAVARWIRERIGADVAPDAVLPVVGSKELIAWLPALLRVQPHEKVAFPALGFPTFRASAVLAGAVPFEYAGLAELRAERPRVVWLNSPSNPDGRVLGAAELRAVVEWAREHGALVVNDECYLDHGWETEPVSVLHPEVCGTDQHGVLAVHSLSKRSNMAGYRAGSVAGDPGVIRDLLEVRRHAGFVVPAPVQAAMVAALGDEDHVTAQRERYRRRRAALREALEQAGFRVERSEASLFLWATLDQPCWDTVRDLADLGVLVSPGELYGPDGARHVRIAFTATDAQIEAACARLAA
ncbi:succinyldiaminopimelate transaminase [Amycolatopsis sp. VC5-11]|uniref:succinyldiaminopimelate transaminase n=1 Tax=Amycolatopsis sp. VC5-11 TaxID=3120156 RepID=UPI00300A422F